MRHVEYWIANDGTQFANEYDCIEHELESDLKETNLTIFAPNGTRYSGTSLLSERVYNECDSVYVPNESALRDIKRIYDFTGFYYGIDQIGKWIYANDAWKKIA